MEFPQASHLALNPYLSLVLERTHPSGVIYLGELRPTWDHVRKSCILTLDKIVGEGGPAKEK